MESRCVKIALRSIMRRRTSIGAAGLTLTNMEGRSGGAAEKGGKTNRGVSSRSMFPKTMRMTRRNLAKTDLKIRI